MYKKAVIGLMLIVLSFIATSSIYQAATVQPLNGSTSEVVVTNVTTKYYRPTEYVVNSEVSQYEHEGEMVYDFRAYFEILENRVDVLNVNKTDADGNQIIQDLGNYEWDFGGFDIETVGSYDITITYKNVSVSQRVKVIAEDNVSPVISVRMTSGSFTIYKNVEERKKAIERYISGIRVTDNVDGIIAITRENFDGLEALENNGLVDKEFPIKLTVTDKAGNESVREITLTTKDNEAPTIGNALKAIVTRVGVAVDYKSHIIVTDNFYDRDEITLEFFIVEQKITETAVEGEYETTYVETGRTEIDFNQLGDQFVLIVARDGSNNESKVVYRVTIENGYGVGTLALIINGGALVIAGLSIGLYFILKKKKQTNEIQ